MEALVATWGLGLASAASPCLLPLYPAFLAYLTGATGKEAGTGSARRISGFLGLDFPFRTVNEGRFFLFLSLLLL